MHYIIIFATAFSCLSIPSLCYLYKLNLSLDELWYLLLWGRGYICHAWPVIVENNFLFVTSWLFGLDKLCWWSGMTKCSLPPLLSQFLIWEWLFIWSCIVWLGSQHFWNRISFVEYLKGCTCYLICVWILWIFSMFSTSINKLKGNAALWMDPIIPFSCFLKNMFTNFNVKMSAIHIFHTILSR